MNVFVCARNASLLGLIRRQYGGLKELALNQLVGEGAIAFDVDDLLFVDRIPEQGFYGCKVKVIVAGDIARQCR